VASSQVNLDRGIEPAQPGDARQVFVADLDPSLPQQLSSRSEAGVKAAEHRGTKRRSAERRGTRAALTLAWAKAAGLDVDAIQVEGDHMTMVKPAIDRATAFFQQHR
jgi:hypothetical protein